MKKFLIFFVALFTITFYLSSGNDSTKSSQADTAKNNSTSEDKGSFLTPKRTPVLLPLPNQSTTNIGGNSASASQKDIAHQTLNLQPKQIKAAILAVLRLRSQIRQHQTTRLHVRRILQILAQLRQLTQLRKQSRPQIVI
jgi:hypothetical protein